MSAPNVPDFNPYASPSTDAGRMAVTSSAEMVKIVKQFRSQMLSLGVFWIIIGLLGAGLMTVAIVQLSRNGNQMVVGIVACVTIGLCLSWVLLGILTCLKHIWAVYIGLVLSYLSVVGNIVNFNWIALIILAVAILQAHRVINWAADLRRKGIPLNARPEDLSIPIGFPPPNQ